MNFPLRFVSFILLLTVCCAVEVSNTVKLLDGNRMPVVGFGTFQMSSEDVDAAVTAALQTGYTHIDTAAGYGNEKDIGKTLKKWFAKGGKREDIYITTKLPTEAMRPAEVAKFLDKQLSDLGLSYLDMYLIHLPFGIFVTPEFDPLDVQEGSFKPDYSTDHIAIWRELEKQVRDGKVKSIGLSNFNKSQVLRVWEHAEIKPANLQVETNAYIQQEELLQLCEELGIVLTGYSPLASGGTIHMRRKRDTLDLPPLIQHPVVISIAERHGKTPAQVALRHGLQRNIVVIPKSTKPKRIEENFDVFDFELSEEEMRELKALDQHGKYRKFDFLSFTGIENHPEYPFTDKIPK